MTADGEASTFSSELTTNENGETVLTLTASGTAGSYIFAINGFTLYTLKESDVRYLTLSIGCVKATLAAEGFAAGEAYGALKAAGVGERRISYWVTLFQTGECESSVWADGERVEANVLLTVEEAGA